MPYSPNWSDSDISRYKAIKRQKISDGMDEDEAQEHAARIVNATSKSSSSPTPQGKTKSPMKLPAKIPTKPMKKMLPVARLADKPSSPVSGIRSAPFDPKRH